MKDIVSLPVLVLIRFYQVVFSPFFSVIFGANCRYEVTCSQFAEKAVRRNGAIRALPQILLRLLSCNPWFTFRGEVKREGIYGK